MKQIAWISVTLLFLPLGMLAASHPGAAPADESIELLARLHEAVNQVILYHVAGLLSLGLWLMLIPFTGVVMYVLATGALIFAGGAFLVGLIRLFGGMTVVRELKNYDPVYSDEKQEKRVKNQKRFLQIMTWVWTVPTVGTLIFLVMLRLFFSAW